ncbi:MAG: sigma-54 dependent transcriptional regulator [Firmicutes bacterium]|jgi:two-component system response regulator AtoC|nr:sigma-54 dependent transcriptional regulator [Bacillota bacterium]
MSRRPSVLVVDDEEAILASLRFALEDQFEVVSASSPEHAVAVAQSQGFHVCLLDLRLGSADGMDLLSRLRQEQPDATFVVMTAYGSIRSAVDCMKGGAPDYITKPLDVEELKAVLSHAAENATLRRTVRRLDRELEVRYGPGGLIGRSPGMRQVFSLIEKARWIDSNVLILGESGTGKELVAKALHYTGKRKHGPFEAINCSAIPYPLLESELFGHERGAFTGAVRRKPGRFEAADGGTLFLDEIGDMDPGIQAKMLRVIQDRSVTPLGGTSPRKVDVRIVAASNKDLRAQVEKGEFREDLFYRLNVVGIELPPLRERREDIPLLVQHFLHLYSQRFGKAATGVSPEAMSVLMAAEYRGNVRELENVIERAVALLDPESEPIVQVTDLPIDFVRANPEHVSRKGPVGDGIRTRMGSGPWSTTGESGSLPFKWGDTLEDLERRAILETLRRTRGKRQLTAKLLGISERCLRNKLREYRAANQGLQE